VDAVGSNEAYVLAVILRFSAVLVGVFVVAVVEAVVRGREDSFWKALSSSSGFMNAIR